MATSGTVSLTRFQTRKVIDSAFRNCRLTPQQITSEHLQNALEQLYLFLSTLANKGIALWCIQEHILPLYENVSIVPCPLGTVDVLNSNLRTLTRLSGTPTSSQGVAANAFDGDLTTACIETTPAGFIRLALDGPMSWATFGIMPNATGLWNISVQVSNDGITYTDVYTNAALPVVAGQWQWFDVDGVLNVSYIRLLAHDTTVLNVTEFFIGNNPNEIPMAPLNRDDYTNLPNKTFAGRPVQAWFNKQRDIPQLILWPVPQFQFTFGQITVWTQRYPEDVGTLNDDLDIPQGWKAAIIDQLAYRLAKTTKEVDRELVPELKMDAAESLSDAWAGQGSSGPVYIRPNISPYTR